MEITKYKSYLCIIIQKLMIQIKRNNMIYNNYAIDNDNLEAKYLEEEPSLN